MKTFLKYSLLVLMIFSATALIISCSDDDGGGAPMVSYIRVTDPASSDSLLVSAGQGQMIAIMGENLGDVVELWFNDQPASLNPSFITDETIITRVPSEIPTEITDQMKLVFANGETLLYDFSVDISEPALDRMKSEYVNEGDVAVIYGNYFYEPLSVMFTGDVEGEVIKREDEMIEVVVPAGAQPGPITVTTNFGSTESEFWFRDNRNIIASFDGTTNGLWHGPNYITATDDNIIPLDGKFIRMKKDLAAWDWFELYVGPSNSDVALELKNIPADALANPDAYVLKFELNTLKSLTGARIHMYIGPDMPGERGDINYAWEPNINTNGEWETVTIPWSDVYSANQEFAYNPAGYGVSIHFSGPSAVTGDFALDNMRVVPN